jgi:DNA-binding response OmpR family regulator
MSKILLVEDDLILGESLEELLESEGFEVVWVKDGNEALDKTYDLKFDLYLLDVDIPFINGFDLLKSLRDGEDDTPCIFLTAKIDINSLSLGFEVGANDYIKKPFDSDELIIRINTQIKKSTPFYDLEVIYGDITYNVKEERVFKNNSEILLSPMELKLFDFFIRNINKTLTKENILYHLNDGHEGSEATLRVQISKLKKVGLNIVNIRTRGYRLEDK